jgi:16S rRNA (adenine1518-N6/adenine1519-N6)-dimethyltransferase
MGQNLLLDERYLERIVTAANVKPDEPIVEIGAGLGVLTMQLARTGCRVWALEVDAGFVRLLEEILVEWPMVRVLHADALKYDFRPLAAELGTLSVVANLPYSISSRFLFRVYEQPGIFGRVVTLLQKEVAERLVAASGSREYGILSVLLGARATVERLFDVPRSAFYPRPEVTSTAVRITFPAEPPVPTMDSRIFTLLVKTAFSERRKTLRNTLKNTMAFGLSSQGFADAAQKAEIDLSRRAETLAPGEFGRFADEIARVQASWGTPGKPTSS